MRWGAPRLAAGLPSVRQALQVGRLRHQIAPRAGSESRLAPRLRVSAALATAGAGSLAGGEGGVCWEGGRPGQHFPSLRAALPSTAEAEPGPRPLAGKGEAGELASTGRSADRRRLPLLSPSVSGPGRRCDSVGAVAISSQNRKVWRRPGLRRYGRPLARGGSRKWPPAWEGQPGRGFQGWGSGLVLGDLTRFELRPKCK